MSNFLRLAEKKKQALEFKTNVPVDDQFSSPKQIRWSAALGKLITNDSSNGRVKSYSHGLSFYSKFLANMNSNGVDADSTRIYEGRPSGTKTLVVYDINTFLYNESISISILGIRMIDASGDPDYIYVTSNNATDHHGFRQVKKSTMAVTATALADGSGDGQFDDPLGIFYYNSEIFVADYDNSRISVWTKSGETLTYARKYDLGFKPMDLCFDGTNWYVQSATTLYKYDASFTDATKTSVANVGYSITLIPDQGDGNGATIAFTDTTNSHIGRRKCSDLSTATADVGASGNGSSSLCDPVVTGPTGAWQDSEGSQYTVASAANISKNGFSGDFFRASPATMKYKPGAGGFAAITAIDFNADGIVGEIKNLYKCINLTSCKLQTNPSLSLDLSRLSAKLTTLWAYACGSGIRGSIRHMTALTSVNLRENSATQAQVDQWIDDLWQNKDLLGAITVNLNGTNAAPTGAYQSASPPTTGKEKIYDLIENYAWTFAYTR